MTGTEFQVCTMTDVLEMGGEMVTQQYERTYGP